MACTSCFAPCSSLTAAARASQPARGTALRSQQRLPSLLRRAGRPSATRAIAEPERPDGPSSSGTAKLEDSLRTMDRFFERYDVLSAGFGALAVTAVCVKNGQDPGTALSITAVSTVVALVLHELWFGDEATR